MSDNDQLRKGLKRRSFLKTTGGAIATTALLQNVEAADSNPYIGKKHIVNAYLHHEGVKIPDYHTDGGDPTHVVVEDDGFATVVAASIGDFRRNTVVSFRRRFPGPNNRVSSDARNIRLQVDRYNCSIRSAFLDEEYTTPEWSVHPKRSESISVEIKNKTVSVKQNESTTIPLSERSVKMAKNERKTITPVFTVRNYGKVDVYGKPNAKVLPRDSGNPYINHRVLQYLNVAKKSPSLKLTGTNDLLIIEQEDK